MQSAQDEKNAGEVREQQIEHRESGQDPRRMAEQKKEERYYEEI